jgi:hypothetical protein
VELKKPGEGVKGCALDAHATLADVFLALGDCKRVTWQPAGLKGNRLQIRLSGPYFAAFLINGMTIDLQNRQNLSSPSRIFASIP